MARVRLAVALLLPEQVAPEVDGLRRAFGADPSYIAPHITLVPPVNIGDDEVPETLAILRRAAAGVDPPLRLTLGPFDTFLPRNPVIYLAVGGSPDHVTALRDACWDGPFGRPETRPYVPHVTVTRGLSPEDDATVRRLLGRYEREVEIDRLHLLAQVADPDRGRHWVPTADAAFGPRRMIGTGGVEIELSVSTLADPEARRFLVDHGCDVALPTGHWRSIVVAGRMEGSVAGVAWGRQAGRAAVLDHIFVAPAARRTGLAGHLVAAVEHDVARHGGAVLEALPPLDEPGARTLAARGWTERPGPGGPRLWRALGPDDLGQSNSIEA
ncbi:MAG: GNAT family N-acetyltransferase [Acidimicrobiales bacterium]|nr:GNAT family N-acetyltransferase [Acidimicrobiales bacterium]